MRPLSRLCGLAVLVWPILAGAQTPDLTAILERLDRLERENRELADQVTALRARLDGVPSTTAVKPVDVPLDQRVEIQERRVEELAQSKVEAAQKFPIRLTGMALFNAFLNSRQSGGFDYPVTANATGPNHAGATLRQTILGLEFRGPATVAGGTVRGSVYMDFFGGATN